MRVAIYARVSTLDKSQDPENQLRELRAWCANSGHTISREYGPNDHPPSTADLIRRDFHSYTEPHLATDNELVRNAPMPNWEALWPQSSAATPGPAPCAVNRPIGSPRAFGIERYRLQRRTVPLFASGWIDGASWAGLRW